MKPERSVFRRWLAIVAALAAAAGAQAQPADDAGPREVIGRLHGGFVEFAAGEAAELPLAERIDRLRPLIRTTHDLDYIAELTIRRHFDALSPDDRSRFVAAFERLSIATYASRFAGLVGDPFRILRAEDDGGRRATVEAVIARGNGDEVPIDYQLHVRDGRWRIVNITADGVSDLALKRAEYTRILEADGIEAVIAEIEAQIDALD